MRASSEERNIALDIVDMMINFGLSTLYHKEEKPFSLWDWMDKNNLFEQGFDYADGATKAVIFHSDLDSWVIKMRLPREVDTQDYCAKEYENFVAAEEAGLDYYFAATEYLCERDGICFYLQESVICDEEVDGELHSKLQCQYEESGIPYDAENLWNEVDDMDAYDRTMLLYGNEKLSNFIDEHHINDLHCGNFGVAGDHYVMIDFSGYGSAVWG